MKIVRLVGRLGNQMFIYAFAKAIEHYSGEKVYFDVSFYDNNTSNTLELENIFNIKLNIIPPVDIPSKFKPSIFTRIPFIANHKKIFKILHKDNITREKHANKFQPDLLATEGDAYFDGYFQCEKYFIDIKDKLKKDFSFRPVNNPELIKKRREIELLECPVFINVRRGDYVTLDKRNIVHWLCDMSYYQKAAKYMKEKFPNCTFIAVSDETEWLEKNLKIDYPFKIYSSNTPYMDIYLLQACKHGICANSSYSWWAAWLIDNKDKIITAPEPWLQVGLNVDIIPDNWVKFPRLD